MGNEGGMSPEHWRQAVRDIRATCTVKLDRSSRSAYDSLGVFACCDLEANIEVCQHGWQQHRDHQGELMLIPKGLMGGTAEGRYLPEHVRRMLERRFFSDEHMQACPTSHVGFLRHSMQQYINEAASPSLGLPPIGNVRYDAATQQYLTTRPISKGEELLLPPGSGPGSKPGRTARQATEAEVKECLQWARRVPPVRLGVSDIHGVGLLAATPLRKGERLFLCSLQQVDGFIAGERARVDHVRHEWLINDLKEDERELVRNRYLFDRRMQCVPSVGGLNRIAPMQFVNHQEQPSLKKTNSYTYRDGQIHVILRDLAEGMPNDCGLLTGAIVKSEASDATVQVRSSRKTTPCWTRATCRTASSELQGRGSMWRLSSECSANSCGPGDASASGGQLLHHPPTRRATPRSRGCVLGSNAEGVTGLGLSTATTVQTVSIKFAREAGFEAWGRKTWQPAGGARVRAQNAIGKPRFRRRSAQFAPSNEVRGPGPLRSRTVEPAPAPARVARKGARPSTLTLSRVHPREASPFRFAPARAPFSRARGPAHDHHHQHQRARAPTRAPASAPAGPGWARPAPLLSRPRLARIIAGLRVRRIRKRRRAAACCSELGNGGGLGTRPGEMR
eukprot:scaffold7_cov378-Prasinococcus_capsulatus_cf.AAC.17